MEQFTSLSPATKIEAILAANLRPCSKQIVLELAGIDLNTLDNETRQNIEDVFRRWTFNSHQQKSSLYWVPSEQKDDVISRIGVEQKSVYDQIAELGLKMFGIE